MNYPITEATVCILYGHYVREEISRDQWIYANHIVKATTNHLKADLPESKISVVDKKLIIEWEYNNREVTLVALRDYESFLWISNEDNVLTIESLVTPYNIARKIEWMLSQT